MSGFCIVFFFSKGFIKWKYNKRIFFQNADRFHLTDCPSPGYYGDNCSTECPQNCQDGYCDNEEGTCLACKPGFIGPRCDLGK